MTTLLSPQETLPAVENRDDGAPVISGFGSLLEQERALQSFVLFCLQASNDRPAAAAFEQTLRAHHAQLGVVVKALEHCCERLPRPVRFLALRSEQPPLTYTRRLPNPRSPGLLPWLVTFHRSLLRNIEALVPREFAGGRGQPVLLQARQAHEEMVATLKAMIEKEKADGDGQGALFLYRSPRIDVRKQERAWENEGGACLSSPDSDQAVVAMHR